MISTKFTRRQEMNEDQSEKQRKYHTLENRIFMLICQSGNATGHANSIFGTKLQAQIEL